MTGIPLQNLELKITIIKIVIKPSAKYREREPHVFCAFEIGQTVNDVFSPLYESDVTLKGEEFLGFVSQFQGLETQVVGALVALGRIAVAAPE